jgi:small subunit ribosomal protein S6e
MPFKINIGDKSGKTYKLELETEELMGKALHDKIQGKELLADLADYEFEIAGTSDKAGFTSMKNVEGIGLKKELLTYGKGMKKRSRKEGKKKLSNMTPKGLRLRRTVRGKVISPEITQINLRIIKAGKKPLAEVFSDQNKAKEDVHEDTPHVDQNKSSEPEKTEEPEKPVEPEKKEEQKVEEKIDNKKVLKDNKDSKAVGGDGGGEKPSQEETKPVEEKKE